LLTVEGEHWQKTKKINSASFHKGQLKLVDTIQNHFSRIKNIKTGKPMDVFPVLMIWFSNCYQINFQYKHFCADIDSLQHTTEATKNVGSRTKTTFFCLVV
jgi:hypothetical protein